MAFHDFPWAAAFALLPLRARLSASAREVLFVMPSYSNYAYGLSRQDGELLHAAGALSKIGYGHEGCWTPNGLAFAGLCRRTEPLCPVDLGPPDHDAAPGTPHENALRTLIRAEHQKDPEFGPAGVLGLLRLRRVRRFLDVSGGKAAIEWDVARRPKMPRPARYTTAFPRAFSDARRLVALLLESGGSLPLLGEGDDPAARGQAVGLLVSTLLAFVSNAHPDKEPLLVLHPIARGELLRGPPDPPARFDVADANAEAWGVHDICVVVAAAAASPIALRVSDSRPHAKRLREMCDSMSDVPVGINPRSDAPDKEERAALAMVHANRLGLIRIKSTAAVATAAGTQLLSASMNARWKIIAAAARVPLWTKPDGYGRTSVSKGSELFTIPSVPFAERDSVQFILARITAFLRTLPRTGLVPVSDFLRDCSEGSGLAELRADAAKSGLPAALNPDFASDAVLGWEHLIATSLRNNLFPWGGLRVATTPRGIGIGLTAVGEYLLRATDAFDPPEVKEAAVIVQPNFEVVFLGPSLTAETMLSPLAERIGRGTGALFRLTRVAATAAAERGVTGEEFLAALRGVSSRPLPENVEHEVRGWFGRIRRVETGPAVLVRCPDADTAGRVAELLGDRALRLADSIIEVKNGPLTPADKKRLIKAGVLVADQTPPARKKPHRSVDDPEDD